MVGNMRITITVDENYQVIRKNIDNKKELPDKLLDIIIPIIKNREVKS